MIGAKRRKRIGAALLAAVLVLSQLEVTAYAEGNPAGTGLCEHHSEHTAACGYVEAVKGHACEHEHGPECYTDELICGMDEDAEQTATASDAGHTHVQECYGLDCQHEHDGDCGYIEAVKGQPCGYVCKVCAGEPDKDSGKENPAVSGNDLTPPVETRPEGAEVIAVTGFNELSRNVKHQNVPLGAPESDLTLPAALAASGYAVADDADPEPEAITIKGVTWELTEKENSPTAYEEGRETPVIYYYRAVLPMGYELAGDAALPEIEVWYGMASRAGGNDDANNDGYSDNDVAAFRQILADHPTLKNTSGVNENDPASWGWLAAWDTSSPKRIKGLSLASKSLQGTLDVSDLTGLKTMACNNNSLLTALDVSGLTGLTELDCASTGLTVLDASILDSLQALYCFSNKNLMNLNVSGLTKLKTLSCYNNNLTELNVSGLTNLQTLYCSGNSLTGTLDVSGLTNLKKLDCEVNKLTGLNVSGLTNLKDLRCKNNPYTFFKIAEGKTLTVTSAAGGTVWMTAFNKNTGEVTLEARPDTGYTFKEWAGLPDGISTSPTANFTLNTDMTVGAGFASTDATLKSLSLSDGTLAPAFDPATTSYTASVGNGVGFVTITATPNDPKAIVTGNGAKPLNVGNNSFTVTVTAENGTPKKYKITSTRAASTDATLKELSLSNGTLTPAFDPATTDYTAHVNNSVASVTINATASDAKAIVTGDDTRSLIVGDNPFTVTVTAENGTPKEYKITITRAAASTDATLKELSLSNGTLAPAFDPATTSYTANVGNSVTNVTINATANDPKAIVAGNGTKTLAEGVKTFTVTVTAEDGSTASYTVTITRAGATTGGNSSSSSGTSRNYIITTPEPPKLDTPVLAVIELPVSVTEGKPATGAVDDARTSAALAEAGRDAKAKTNGIAVQYDAKTSLTYDGFSIFMQRATLDRLIDAKVKYVTLNTGIVDMTFDLAALQEIQKQATGDITLTAVRETGLAGDALAAVGSRPAYRLSVGYTGADGKAVTVQSFGAGRATVGLAYQPAATEQPGSLYLVYSADGKGAEWLYQSSCDKNSGNVIGSVEHFSVYGVGYHPAPTFTDTVNHWAKADIDFVVSRGLFSGTSETTFSPDSTITRGMFVTALGRLAGIDPAGYPSSSRFTDVPDSAIYAPFVEWAASKGIVSSTGNNAFSPDDAITREQMAVIMRQYADKLGYTLPVAREAVTFTDENQITGSMKDAVQAIQQAGIMSGKGNNRFGPKDAATRAEAAAVLHRFVEVVIDRDTAGGWGQNDAGRWLYYLDGKPVTGWKQIGGKWYYFFPDGSMAADTKIDGYELGPDGARKE